MLVILRSFTLCGFGVSRGTLIFFSAFLLAKFGYLEFVTVVAVVWF